MRVRLAMLLLLILPAAPLAAQTPTGTPHPDSVDTPGEPFFTKKDAVVAGAFAVGALGATYADQHLADWLQTDRSHQGAFVNDAASFFRFMGNPAPEIIGVSMYAAGRLTHHRELAALGLHGVEAILMGLAVSAPVKVLAGRARPYVSADRDPHSWKFARGWRNRDYQSFPSGHATTAFAVASAVTAESRVFWPNHEYLVGTVMLSGASLVGVSRLYHDQHWASDVITGAMIGTFSGFKVVLYDQRHPDNHVDKWLLASDVVPLGGGRYALVHTVRFSGIL